MYYLIFDIECCDGKHICEFGYVRFDENFKIIKRECITINPEQKFKLSAKEDESNLKLYFSKEKYYGSPTFPFYYDKIKEVITAENQKIIGFSMKNDRKFLATACEIYNLPEIPFEFTDLQEKYRLYTKSKNVTSVQKIAESLGIENIFLHKSDDDSFAVMNILKKMCGKEKLSVEKMLGFLDGLSKKQKKSKTK